MRHLRGTMSSMLYYVSDAFSLTAREALLSSSCSAIICKFYSHYLRLLCRKEVIHWSLLDLDMKQLASASPALRYEDHYLSSLVGSEVEISLQSDDSYNSTNWNPPTTFENISILEDPTPVWPGGPPPWWQNDLADEIYDNLKKSETEFPDIGLESPNLGDRPSLVYYICYVADCLNMTNATKFLAVRLLDGYMDKHSIMAYRLKLMALACLSVALKFEDVDYRIPSMRLLLEVGQVDNTFTLEDFKAMEQYLLDFYEWKISHPTPIHFIDFYLHVSALGENYYSFDYKTFQQLAYQLLGLSLQDTNFVLFKSSLVAAAAVLASRALLGIHPHWSDQMTGITGYCFEELQAVATMMMQLFYQYQQASD